MLKSYQSSLSCSSSSQENGLSEYLLNPTVPSSLVAGEEPEGGECCVFFPSFILFLFALTCSEQRGSLFHFSGALSPQPGHFSPPVLFLLFPPAAPAPAGGAPAGATGTTPGAARTPAAPAGAPAGTGRDSGSGSGNLTGCCGSLDGE